MLGYFTRGVTPQRQSKIVFIMNVLVLEVVPPRA